MKKICLLVVILQIYLSFASNGLGECCQSSYKYPKAELKFPGVSDFAVEKNSKDVAAIISTWTGYASKGAKFIPVAGEVLGHVLTAVSVMSGMLKAAETGLGKFVGESLAIQSTGDIQAKLVTIQNRLKRVEQDIEQGEKFDVPIGIAEDKCEEVLAKFSQDSSFLWKNDNYMLSSPSLVSFTGVYAAVAAIRFEFSKVGRGHTITQMKMLKQVVEKYRDATVSKRMSFIIKQKNCSKKSMSCKTKELMDLFYELTPCQSCRDAYRKFTRPQGSFYFEDHSEHKFFVKYEDELNSLYSDYFNIPLQELNKLIQTFENKINP